MKVGFRELEMYAGNKWLVYIDAREEQFLEDAELSLMQCQNSDVSLSSPPFPVSTFSAQSVFPID